VVKIKTEKRDLGTFPQLYVVIYQWFITTIIVDVVETLWKNHIWTCVGNRTERLVWNTFVGGKMDGFLSRQWGVERTVDVAA
jgi:hypothetical protein